MMLRRPCKILGPFTFAATKKTSVLRYNLNLKFPFGCFYHRKSIYQHIGRNKGFSEKECKVTAKSVLREQKNFIWTSFLFLKDKNSGESKPTLENNETSDKVKDESVNSVVNTNLPDPDKENSVKVSNKSSKDSANVNESPSTPILGFLKSKSLNKKDESIEQKDQFSKGGKEELKNKKKTPDVKTKAIPGIDSKVLVKPCLEKSSDQADQGVRSHLSCKDRRKSHNVNLGAVSDNEKLEEPPSSYNSETGRACDQGDILKGASHPILIEKAKAVLKACGNPGDENSRSVKVVNLGPAKGDINIPVRRRQTVDLNRSSTERNFITPVRAMTDFLLKPSDLEGLRKTKRRSPYENDPPITVYWRKDVEAKALDVWGSKENLLKEILKRDIERRRYQQNLFTVKRRLRDYRREQGRESEFKMEQSGLLGSSGKVVLTAIAINGTNFLFKLLAWLYTGSHSMFSEAVHSLADTINQLILAYGIHKSVQRADSDHPYGYTNMRYVASLISGVGIFCVGSGLSFYHGFVGLTDLSDLHSFYWAYFILCGSLVSEGATLLVAFNSIRVGARNWEMSISEYVLRGQDPSVNVVLLEDLAAVVGVCFATCCMGLSSYFNSHIPDAIGSFLVGGLLGCVASFIIYTNVAALVGRSIPQERLDKINSELESDVMIRAIHDVKGIDIGNSLVRYKAEMDFDGGELTRSYLDKQDLNQMLEEVRKMQTIDELEEFMLKHGENIVDMMGGEIDRIELKLRKKHPEIRHCDLEIL